MKHPVVYVVCAVAALSVVLIVWSQTFVAPMRLTSTAFGEGERIPEKYTCDGENVNPPLAVRDVPKGTKSLTITMIDPDVPKTPWVHWLVYGLDPGTEIVENMKFDIASEGMTSFKKSAYGGPCPPSGKHHYIFTAYAVSTPMVFHKAPDINGLKRAMKGNVLGRAELTGIYYHP